MRRIAAILAVVIISVLVGAGAFAAVDHARGGGSSANSAVSTTTAATKSSNSNVSASLAPAQVTAQDFSALYTAVRPSIVEITTGTQGSNAFSQRAQGLGSGIVLDTDGHILTNDHVVNGSRTVTVTFSDGTTAQATVVGTDAGNDIAIVKTDADKSELHPAKLGDSSNVKVGNTVAAVGNPFGLDGSFTTGVISGLDRTLQSGNDGRPIRNLLQTDAAVNPGNSGGGLFNMNGEVIGINTAIENPGGSTFAGIAYAVPINTPKRLLSQLTSGTTITHARLGISGNTLSPSNAKSLGVPYGVAVISVDPGSAADKAGLQPSSNGSGDVVVAIDGQPTKTFDDLANYIDTKSVGDQVKLTVHRDGKDIQLTAMLESWDSSA
jgi:S1-C subfamily serine protease